MRPSHRGGGAAGASARALLVVLFLALLIGSRCLITARIEPRGLAASGYSARNRSPGQRNSHGGSGRVAVLPRKAMPMVGTRPVPARMSPAGSAEESKRRIPSCPDPLHNR